MKRREPKTIPLLPEQLNSLTIDKEHQDGGRSSRSIYPTPDYEPRPGPERPSPWK